MHSGPALRKDGTEMFHVGYDHGRKFYISTYGQNNDVEDGERFRGTAVF